MDITKLTKPARKLLPLKTCGAVIVAAGTASRMGGIDKVMAPLGGEPMIARTVRTFQNCDAISEIVIVTREDLILPITALTREMPKVKLAAIQDGARPLITWEVIDRTVRAANSYGAAAPAIPVKDTIKVVEGRVVKNTPDRATLFAVQTPQVFDFDLLRAALKKAEKEGSAVTDDCSAVELMGMSVKIVEGDERNIKVTTPMDLKIAELLLEELS